jgi:HAD superfamily phosphoserine phosphatase-like hydrolase
MSNQKILLLVDFCKTLVDTYSADEFTKTALQRTSRTKYNIAKLTSLLYPNVFDNLLERHGLKKALVFLLKGIPIDELKEVAEYYEKNSLRNNTNEKAFEFIRRKQRKNPHTTIILSAGYEIYINVFAENADIPIDAVHASRICFTDNGLCSGYLERNLFGKRKVELIKDKMILDLSNYDEIISISDSINDLPMLSVADKPVVFNPDHELRRIARRNNYHIIDPTS